MEEVLLYGPDESPAVPKRKMVDEKWKDVAITLMFMVVFTACIGLAAGDAHGRYASKQEVAGSITSSSPAVWISTITPQTQQWMEDSKKEQARLEHIWNTRPRLAAPDDGPPRLIKVGPYMYAVNYTTKKALDTQNALALTDMASRDIWLNPRRTANLRSDLLHELMHCAKDLGTGGGRFRGVVDTEENTIDAIDSQFLVIMRENPDVMNWLLKAAR